MLFNGVVVESLEYVLPEEVWTSSFIENKLAPLYERLKLPQGRLEHMTGIKERRFWPLNTKPSVIASQAGRKALDNSQFGAKDIDLLVHASVCRDHLEPATAAFVHRHLAVQDNAQIFDVSNACLGFLNALAMAASMIQNRHVKRALIVSGENGRPLIENTLKTLLEGNFSRQEIKPFFANLTIGAGAVAAILCHEDDVTSHKPRLVAATSMTDSEANELCLGQPSGLNFLEMQTDANALLEAGVRLAQKSWQKYKQVSGWNQDTAERIICHQVGRQHQRKLFEALDLPVEKDFATFPTLGNAGSASLPITLAKAMEEGAILPDDFVALLGVGSGLSTLILGMHI